MVLDEFISSPRLGRAFHNYFMIREGLPGERIETVTQTRYKGDSLPEIDAFGY